MGIELDMFNKYDARCDGCDTVEELNAKRASTAQVMLRARGWKRGPYINAAHHYTWICPKCKAKDVTIALFA